MVASVHAREGENRKAGWFEVIVGKSMAAEKKSKRFGFVVDYDEKPKRRLYEMLQAQGLQMNQAITFLSSLTVAIRCAICNSTSVPRQSTCWTGSISPCVSPL